MIDPCDWVYCEELDETFKVLDKRGNLLQMNSVVWVQEAACEAVLTSECAYCKEQKPHASQERYSAGCYAGRMCDDCAYRKYRDHCGVDGTPQLTQADVDEPIEPEEYYGSQHALR